MPSGYQVTRLPVTFVIHNVCATINIMVTKWLLLYSKLLCEILRKLPSGYQVIRLPVTFVIHNVYVTIKIMVTKWLLSYFKKHA